MYNHDECPFIAPYRSPSGAASLTAELEAGSGLMFEAEKLMQIALVLPSAVVIGWLGGPVAGRPPASALDCDCRHCLWHASPDCFM